MMNPFRCGSALPITSLLLVASSIATTCLPVAAQLPRFVTTNWPWGGGTFSAFALEPSGCILAAAHPTGLYRSCDGGATWTTVRDHSGGLPGSSSAVFVDSSTGRIFVAAFARPLQALTPPSGRWEVVVPSAQFQVRYLVTGRESLLFAKVDDGVYRSSDHGDTWSRSYQSAPKLPDSRVLAADRRNGLLYLLAGNGLERSTDDGATWHRIVDSLWTATKPHIAVTAAGALIVANEQGDVLRSIDSGGTWSEVLTQNAEPIRAIHVGASGRLYLGAGGGRSYVSEDDGRSWTELAQEESQKPLIALFELSDGTLLGAVEYDQRSIVRLDRQNGPWQFSGTGISNVSLGRPSSNVDGTLYVPVVGTGVYYRSDNGGGTWQKDSTGIDRAYSVALGTTRRGTLLVGLHEKGVARRELGSTTWSISSSSFGGTFEKSHRWYDTDMHGRVWVGTGSGAFSSLDDGVTWYPTMQGLAFTAVDVRDDGLILLGTASKTGHDMLYRSVDGGNSYEVSNTGVGTGVNAIEFLPSGEALLATNDGLRISRDDGTTWWPIMPDSLDVLMRSMIVDGYGAVYAATSNAIYVSRDTARTWTRWTEGLSGSIEHLAMDSSGVLHVATLGAGMLKSVGPVASAPAEDEGEASTVDRIVVRRGSDIILPLEDHATETLRVDVFDVGGERLASLADAPVSTMNRSVTVETRGLRPGIYLARVILSGRVRVVLLHITG